jgi:hypothetical protein
MLYLMIFIMHGKYKYTFVYIWSNFKGFDSSESEMCIYFDTEGVPHSASMETCLIDKLKRAHRNLSNCFLQTKESSPREITWGQTLALVLTDQLERFQEPSR